MSATWSARDVAGVLRRPTATDDKYSRGVLGVRTGSVEYPGAAVLGVEAAWRTGLGMVRYLGTARDAVLARRPETVAAEGRVQAWLIGSGTNAATRPHEETTALRGILSGDLPVVVDAGALDLAPDGRAPIVVTPHDREHDRLRTDLGLGAVRGDRAQGAVETARALGNVVLLKGSVTIVADPGGGVLRVGAATPWLATAGTGDVLAGVLGALLAGAPAGADLAPIAASAAWLHGRAGALASSAHAPARSLSAARADTAGGPITALDVAEALPRAVAEVLAG
ncbi:ADP-dependent NAD(P)H-hydrate dehydratase [Microbacterium sp.]|uniref:ADP-dependent NAD(P)H-hydrate dehydratase n=1 Tax=Microbacterium sp. TaxID=51671 RepID=UPI003F71A156